MERPRFINPDIGMEPLSRGRFTDVAALDIPDELKEKFESGWVVKEYRQPYDPELSDDTRPTAIARKLRDRNEFLQYYFRELPDFVGTNEYVIGGTRQNPVLYEFQRKIDSVFSLDQVTSAGFSTVADPETKKSDSPQRTAERQQYIEVFEKGWAALNAEARETLAEQLSKLIPLLKAMPAWRPQTKDEEHKYYQFLNHVVDLFGRNNILIDEKGLLHLIDTNFLFNLKVGREFMFETAEETYGFNIRGVERALQLVHQKTEEQATA